MSTAKDISRDDRDLFLIYGNHEFVVNKSYYTSPLSLIIFLQISNLENR